MTYTVRWARKTVKQLDKLDRTAQKKIVLAVTKLAKDPRPSGVKSLVTRPTDLTITPEQGTPATETQEPSRRREKRVGVLYPDLVYRLRPAGRVPIMAAPAVKLPYADASPAEIRQALIPEELPQFEREYTEALRVAAEHRDLARCPGSGRRPAVASPREPSGKDRLRDDAR